MARGFDQLALFGKGEKQKLTKSIMGDKDEPEGQHAKKDKADPKRQVEEVSIRRVDNGFTASIHYKKRKEKSSKGEEITKYEDPSTKVFHDVADAIGILEDCNWGDGGGSSDFAPATQAMR